MTTENKFTLTIPECETTEFRIASLSIPVILQVSTDGAFTWHKDAGRLIEEGNFTGMESMQHILRALWKAQHSAPQPAVQPLTGWQPITTAPKDGTEVLLWFPHRQVTINGFYGEVTDGDWETGVKRWMEWQVADELWFQEEPEQAPTHWMPLPAAPSCKENAEKRTQGQP